MALPAVAAAAYQAAAKFGADASITPSLPAAGTSAPTQSFSDFLSNAVDSSVNTMKQGESMATKQMSGQADIVDVVNAVNSAEITLDTVVAVRDKVVSAYQAIMNMPI
jgi:flagellar hook-basal body complex protein FliE